VRIGVMLETERPFEQVVAQATGLRDAGIDTAWSSQIFAYDALTALAAVGREVPGIGFGTAVVPTYPRHPVMLAGQALTVQAATGGRLTLGIGLSHQLVVENVFGQSFEKPTRHMKEYLSILMPLLLGEQVTFAGQTLSASTFGPLQIDAPAPPVLVAALGLKEKIWRLDDPCAVMGPAGPVRSHVCPLATPVNTQDPSQLTLGSMLRLLGSVVDWSKYCDVSDPASVAGL